MKNIHVDLLDNNKDFAIEKLHYHSNVSMGSTHYHSHYEILYIQQGQRKIIVNDSKTHELNSASIALLPPNIIHQTISDSDTQQCRVLINISKQLMNEIIEFTSSNITLCFDCNALELTPYDRRVVSYNLQILLDADKSSSLYEDTIKTTLASMLVHLSNVYLTQHKVSQIPMLEMNMRNNMDVITKYISENYDTDISLSTLANLVHITEEYLIRCFKIRFGTTPMKFLNNYRITTAKRLIEGDTMNISQIATACGFNSNTAFSRSFKAITGMSPKEYQLFMRKKRN